MRAIACLIFAALFTAPSITIAQSLPDPPPAISPLHSEQDPNGVNMTDGQKNVDMPVVLSVPAAPRLTFDKVQNSAPSLSGVIAHNAPDEDGTASWSVHSGGDTSESFRCDPIDVCSSVTSSGSMFRYAGRQFQQVGSGAVYDFTVRHSRSSGGTSTTEFRYAASVSYPDGEVISYTYEDGYDPQDPLLGLPPCVEGSPPNTDCRTYRRPTLIESRTGYYITIAYQYTGTDATNALWSAPSQAAIYDPSGTLIRRLVYGSDGSVTDYGASPTNVGGRVFATSNVVNGLGGQLETPVASVQLPTEGSAQLTVNPASNTDPTLSRVIGSVVRDGVTWNYNYANVMMYLTCTYTGSATIKYDSVTVTGQNGYSVTYAMHPASEFAGNGAGCANSGANLYHNVIKSSTDALGRMTSYNYDLRTGILYGITLPESNGVTVGNDQCGNLTSKTTLAKPGSGLANTSESAAYLPEGFPGNECPDVTYYRPTSSTDALGRVTNYTYNGLGQMTQELAPADSAGVRRETDVTYSTNAAGLSLKTLVRVCGGTSCTGNAESHTDYTYGSNSALPLTVVQKDEATGQTRTTTYSYDAAGRVLSVDGPLAGTGDAKYFRYDTYGRKTWEISEAAANGIRLAKVFTYRDSDDKVISAQTGTITSPTDTNLVLSEQTDTTYDSRRYPIREKTYKGATTYRVTDRSFLDRGLADCAAVRMNFAALPAATATGACSLGTAGSDGNDRITKNVYDNAGQLLKVQKALLTPRQQDYVTYAYTPNSKQQYVTDANGNKAQFKYDGLDRLQCWIFPSKTTAGTVSGDGMVSGVTGSNSSAQCMKRT